MASPPERRAKSRWLRRAAWAVLAAFTLAGLLLAFLPRIVSSGWFRAELEALASRAVRRAVRIGDLTFTWSGELRLEGLEVADLPEFSSEPLLSVGRLRVQVDLRALLRRRIDLDLALDGLEARVIRSADGRTNVEAFLAGLPPRKPRAAGPIVLPFDQGRMRVLLAAVRVRALDRERGRAATIESASLRLDLPSFAEPATLEFHAGLTADGRALPPLRLRGRVERLIRPDGTLNLEGAVVEADGVLPGSTLDLHVDLERSVARGRVTVDLPVLMDAARPFAPARIAATEVGGRLGVELGSAAGPGGSLGFEFRVTGVGLTVAGGLLESRRLGPLDLAVDSAGALDAARRAFAVERGEVRLQRRTRASWTVAATGLGGPAPEVSASVGPATLDLEELMPLARPLLPGGTRLSIGESKRASLVTLARAEVAGPVAGGTRRIRLEGLGLALPRFEATRGAAAVAGSDLAFTVERLEGLLAGLVPERLLLQAAVRCERLKVVGPRAASIEGLDVTVSTLDLADIARTGGPLGVALRMNGTHAAAIRAFEVPGVAKVRGYRHAGDSEFTIGRDDNVGLVVKRASLAIASVSAGDGPEGASIQLDPSATSPGVSAEVEGLRVSGRFPDGPNPAEVERAALAFGRVRAKSRSGLVTGEQMQLEVRALSASLRRQFPERIAARVFADIGGIRLAGDRQASVKDLKVSSLDLTVSELRRVTGAPFGVAAKFSLAQSASAGEVDVPARARATGLRASLRVAGDLAPDGPAALIVDAFGIDVDLIRAAVPGVGTVETPAHVGGRLDRILARGAGTTEIDVEGLHATAAVGDAVQADVQASARGLGSTSIATDGESRIDLGRLARLIPPERLHGGELAGTATVRWALDGRLEAHAAAPDGAPSGLVAALGLGSLRQAALSANLADVDLKLTLPGGARVAAAGIATEEPFAARMENGLLSARGAFRAGRIGALPGLGAIGEPFAAAMRVRMEQTGPGSLRVAESIAVERLGLTQEAQAELSGLDRLLARGLGTPLPAWLGIIGGEARASIGLANVAGLGLVAERATMRGGLTAGMDARLASGEDLSVGAWVKATDVTAAVTGGLEVKQLDGDIALEKRYRLARVEKGAASRGTPAVRLSEEVLNDRVGGRAPAGGTRAARFSRPSAVTFGQARLGASPVPLEARHLGIELSLANGLPVVDRFRAELLGGSVVGTLGVAPPARRDGPLRLTALATFTGLDAERLGPGAEPTGAPASTDTELSGRLSVSMPLGTRLESVLAGMDMVADLSHIGARTLDRALYALDPTGSNETMVKQRRLLRLGTPRRVTVAIRNGNLSLSGRVEVAGVELDLPGIDRVNVAGLPGLARVEASLAAIAPILDVLRAAGADVLEFDDAGRVRFRSGDAR